MSVSKARFSQEPLYDNFFLIAPDDAVSPAFPRKGALVLGKGIAEPIVHPDGQLKGCRLKLSLLAGPTKHEYYTSQKMNQCVICGVDTDLMKHLIVPKLFRMHMPVDVKEHSSHDIVLLCVDCHMSCNRDDDRYKRRVQEVLGRSNPNMQKLKVDKRALRVTRAASALLKAGNKIPKARREELLFTIEGWLKDKGNGPCDISDDVLKRLSTLDCTLVNESFVSPAKIVIDLIIAGDASLPSRLSTIEAFVKSWRRHFVDTQQPRYLPVGWSISHRVGKYN